MGIIDAITPSESILNIPLSTVPDTSLPQPIYLL